MRLLKRLMYGVLCADYAFRIIYIQIMHL